MCGLFVFFFFKQKTAYEMRISDWSSDVCSSDLNPQVNRRRRTVSAMASTIMIVPAMGISQSKTQTALGSSSAGGTGGSVASGNIIVIAPTPSRTFSNRVELTDQPLAVHLHDGDPEPGSVDPRFGQTLARRGGLHEDEDEGLTVADR